MDEQVNQPRHRHVPTTVQKQVFERFILGLNPVVCVVVQLPPHTEWLGPTSANKQKETVPPPIQENYLYIRAPQYFSLPSF